MTGLGTWSCRISTPLVKDRVYFTLADCGGKYKVSLRIKSHYFDDIPVISAQEQGGTLQLRLSGEIYKPGACADAELNFEGDTFTGSIVLPLLGRLRLLDGKREDECTCAPAEQI